MNNSAKWINSCFFFHHILTGKTLVRTFCITVFSSIIITLNKMNEHWIIRNTHKMHTTVKADIKKSLPVKQPQHNELLSLKIQKFSSSQTAQITIWCYITPIADFSSDVSLQREAALFHKEEIHGNSMQNRLVSWPPLVNQIKTQHRGL